MSSETTTGVPRAGALDDGNTQEFIEGVQIELRAAPVFKRFLAACVDIGIVTAASYAALIPLLILSAGTLAVDLTVLRGEGGLPILTIVLVAIFGLAVMTAFHLYFILFEFKKGATPGKKVFGLKVVSVDGRRLTKGQVVYRDMVRWYVDALLLVPAAISMLVTEKRQRVGDLLAGTMVVHSRAKEEQANFTHLYVKAEDYAILKENLQPMIVPGSVREKYLPVAYRAFIQGQEAMMAEELKGWVPFIREFLGKTEALGLNEITVLRFFAELCFQTDRDLRISRK